jgi:hypothetical protein
MRILGDPGPETRLRDVHRRLTKANNTPADLGTSQGGVRFLNACMRPRQVWDPGQPIPPPSTTPLLVGICLASYGAPRTHHHIV